ncbi:UbiA-like polyprenyltransferase [Nannocystis bainbridge]|uniref:4-hydroxybenzoate polyprenyltransferase n=1 Tax=Nannocystis bainbridge TaxID=2995303 RepID=A0ABT5DUI7_9BACT|nr:UbiA-like polyprenyltransferase [Nannocystis bainbridge]MDC0717308.1 putative 4-hydroxybenzoate polyprenyltransferase [Nannocystis bainbridge]
MTAAPAPWLVVRRLGGLVRFSHTVFGLPFALAAVALAHRHALAHGGPGLDLGRLALIVLAFTAARTAAMGFNRIVDRRIDAANPRTAMRELPAGLVSLRAAVLLTVVASVAFLGCAWLLGPVPLLLSPACLLVVLAYSYFKRFSWAAHLVLGVALALAPGGAWVAVTGDLAAPATPLWLMLAVATWVAGFDILYSLQDEAFDREQRLHSIPVRFGTVGALVFSGLLHVATVAALMVVHVREGLGVVHGVGVALIAAILVYEHAIVRPGDLSRIDKAFFDLNGYISLAYLACALIATLL